MKLIHTLLFLLRENMTSEDLEMANACLRSLGNSTHKTVVVYNQGYLTNDELKEYLEAFNLDFHIIGDGVNVGITAGRQSCFNYVWEHFPDTKYISEIHLDMCFSSRWEDPLIEYLALHDEPMISSGIIDRYGNMPCTDISKPLPQTYDAYDDFLRNMREDQIVHGYTHPCIHVSQILKEVGGYDLTFLKGMQCFEDDSLLLGYFYYYGTRSKWYPKISFSSVTYHAVMGQRMSLHDSIMVNYNGLVKQYGAMGLKHLCDIHMSQWHKNFFGNNYEILIGTN